MMTMNRGDFLRARNWYIVVQRGKGDWIICCLAKNKYESIGVKKRKIKELYSSCASMSRVKVFDVTSPVGVGREGGERVFPDIFGFQTTLSPPFLSRFSRL